MATSIYSAGAKCNHYIAVTLYNHIAYIVVEVFLCGFPTSYLEPYHSVPAALAFRCPSYKSTMAPCWDPIQHWVE